MWRNLFRFFKKNGLRSNLVTYLQERSCPKIIWWPVYVLINVAGSIYVIPVQTIFYFTRDLQKWLFQVVDFYLNSFVTVGSGTCAECKVVSNGKVYWATCSMPSPLLPTDIRWERPNSHERWLCSFYHNACQTGNENQLLGWVDLGLGFFVCCCPCNALQLIKNDMICFPSLLPVIKWQLHWTQIDKLTLCQKRLWLLWNDQNSITVHLKMETYHNNSVSAIRKLILEF